MSVIELANWLIQGKDVFIDSVRDLSQNSEHEELKNIAGDISVEELVSNPKKFFESFEEKAKNTIWVEKGTILTVAVNPRHNPHVIFKFHTHQWNVYEVIKELRKTQFIDYFEEISRAEGLVEVAGYR